MLAILKRAWPIVVTVVIAIALSAVFWYVNRIWLAHRDDLEGCRYWCQNHVKYDTPDKYVACVRKCKVTIDAP